MKRRTNKKTKREQVGQHRLVSHMDLMDEVIDALGNMVGIKDSQPDIENGSISYTPQTPNAEKIQRLYKNPQARPMIDKFFELGNIDKAKYGLG